MLAAVRINRDSLVSKQGKYSLVSACCRRCRSLTDLLIKERYLVCELEQAHVNKSHPLRYRVDLDFRADHLVKRSDSQQEWIVFVDEWLRAKGLRELGHEPFRILPLLHSITQGSERRRFCLLDSRLSVN